MSDPANPPPETSDERASALLADAARAAHGRYPGAETSLATLMQPDRQRLSEVERITIRSMFKELVESTEGELRARLLTQPNLPDVPEFVASLGAAHVAIAWPILIRAGLPEDRELAEILIRRGKSYSFSRNLRQHATMTEQSRLDTLTEHGDPDIAADAMKMLIAESRVNDRFDDPRLSRADLPKPIEHRLVWTIAAALRDYGERVHQLDGSLLDIVLSNVAGAMLNEQDDDQPAELIAMALARKLDAAGMIDAELLIEALNSARFTLYVAMLAHRAGTRFDIAWEMTAMPDAPSHMILLKSIDIERDAASQLLVATARSVSSDDRIAEEAVASWIEVYDALGDDAVEAAMRPWRLDADYRSATARFGAIARGVSQ